MRRATIFPLAWISAHLAAADIREPMDSLALAVAPSVVIDDFDIPPAGNMLLGSGRVELHVKALVGAGYNSNVLAVPGGSPDHDTRGMAGIAGRYLPDPDATLAYDFGVRSSASIIRTIQAPISSLAVRDWMASGIPFSVCRHSAMPKRYAAMIPLFETGEQILHEDYSTDLAIDPQHTLMPWQLRLRFERRGVSAGFGTVPERRCGPFRDWPFAAPRPSRSQ